MRKKGYYIYYATKAGLVGVDKKVANQMSVFRKYVDIDEIVVEREESNFIKSIIWRLPFFSFGRNYEKALQEIENPDFIYIRVVPLDRRFLNFVETLRESYPECKLLLEIPTFPYRKELLGDISMFPFYFKDLFYQRKLVKYIDRIVTFSEDDSIYGIPTIKTGNGILVDKVEPVKSLEKKDTIDLLAVGILQKSHGYERCICSLAQYYREQKDGRVELHIVGDGTELKFYKNLTKKQKIEEHVHFYGRKTGTDLNKIYEKMDIGLGCFGLYKRKIYRASALKTREYLAKGLPVVSGCKEDIFEHVNVDFYLEYPNDKSSIDMNRIVDFHDRLYQKDRKEVRKKIREFAQNTVDMEIVLKPIIQYLL